MSHMQSLSVRTADTDAPLAGRPVGLHSLRYRLTFLILALLAIIGATFAWMAYREVQQALRLSGTERAGNAAQQIADLLAQSAAARSNETRRMADDPEVQKLFQAGDPSATPKAPAVVQQFLTRNEHATVWLYDAHGRLIGQLTNPGKAAPATSGAFTAVPPEGFSPLRLHEGRVSYFVTVRVGAASGGDVVPPGYFSVQRSLRSSAASGLIERLVGAGAGFKLGNTAGDLWTDLSSPVAAPPNSSATRSGRYISNGEMRLGASAAVTGTPWTVWADISETSILAPAYILVQRMAPITLLIIIMGALAVYIVSTRVTRPLERLTEAAQALAAGDHGRRVAIRRRDEIGRLAAVFNAMAARVAESHEDLEARVRARTEELEAFSYSVSHDLRAPLRHIMGFGALLQQSGSTYLTEQDRRYLKTMIESAARMSRLVDDLLGFCRIGREQMRRMTVDLGALVAEVIAEHAQDVQNREIEWVLHPLPQIFGDRPMLKVALTNLVANALKYTSKRAHARIEIGASNADGRVVIYVRDNGVGFDMEYANKLFGVFQRLHTHEEFEGNGIGLANVQRVTERHGGRVWAEGEVDRGATFFMSLPTAAT